MARQGKEWGVAHRSRHWALAVLLLSTVASLAEEGEPAAHWAFQPLADGKVPPVVADWIANPLDAFVWERLSQRGWAPNPLADSRVLVRRLAFTLTGLPPGPEDWNEGVERLLDRYLASPAYGEHWARHWLDVARYSDAKGYVDAGEPRYPFAYTYRDYVVQAFATDLPFRQFVREQIAADRLGRPLNHPSSAALGLLTVGSRFNFFPHDIIDDRIDVVTRGFLGLSVACARCHDHKFDPVSIQDYYGLYAIFANSREPHLGEVPPLTAPGKGETAAFQEELLKAVEAYETWRRETHEQIKKELCGWAGDYLRYLVQSLPGHRTQAQPDLVTERGMVREVSAYSGGGLRRWRRFLETCSETHPVFGLWARMAARSRDALQEEAPQLRAQWVAETVPNARVVAAVREADPRSLAALADTYAAVIEEVDAAWRRGGSEELSPDEQAILDCLYTHGGPGDLSLEASADCYTLNESVKARQLAANIERVFLKDGEIAPRPMMLFDRAKEVPQRVFVRGDAYQLGQTVPRAVPELLRTWGQEITRGSGRRELAEMLAHPDNPLTMRVWVNRVWAWHFGSGLVATPSDFGRQGERPSHPRLLDFLAAEFRNGGGSTKALHRMILTSSTWRQKVDDQEACRAEDPENRYLWRMHRRRLSFESMRDAMLAVAGRLDRQQFGQPLRLAPDAEEHRRRTLYTYLDREKLPELFRVFDFPSPEITATQRSLTNVPQQSLFLLNNPFALAQAQALLRTVDGAGRRVEAIYQRLFGREPDAAERRLAEQFIRRGEAGEAARWAEWAQTMLLCNEFQFVD